MTTLAAPFLPLASVRSDTLPENTRYRDDGCDVAARCLDCPLPVCKYDDPGWLQRENRHDRDVEILRRRDQGQPIPAIAHRFGLSTRTVHRVLQRGAPGAVSSGGDEGRPLISLQELATRSLFRRRTPWPRLFQGPSPVNRIPSTSR
jgi:hypothetical protein